MVYKDKVKEEYMNENFKKELISLLNRYGWDGACEMADYILADYVERCLENLCSTMGINRAWCNNERLENKE